MASLGSRLFRSLRLIQRGRSYASTPDQEIAMLKMIVKEGRSKDKEIAEAFDAGTGHWRFVSYFGVFPITAGLCYSVFFVHWDLDEEDEPIDPEVKGMNMQRKNFPWGNGVSIFRFIDPFGDQKRREYKAEHGLLHVHH